MVVIQNQMDSIDPNKPKESIQTIEQYIRYLSERLQWAFSLLGKEEKSVPVIADSEAAFPITLSLVGGNYVADKTGDEILQAVNDSKIPFVIDDEGIYCHFDAHENNMFYFRGLHAWEDKVVFYQITMTNIVTKSTENYVSVQAQANWTESDNTKASFIKNKPSIPAAQVNSDWNASSGVAQILNKPSLANVATSGSYDDLSNKPSALFSGLGNAIALGFNQLVKTVTFTITSASVSGDIFNSTCDPNHKYLFMNKVSRPAVSKQNTDYQEWMNYGSPKYYMENECFVFQPTQSYIAIRYQSYGQFAGDVTLNTNLFDLTAMFGAGNEPTAEVFRSMFSADYYPFHQSGNADLLWTNASPTSAFTSQIINVDLSQYRFVLISLKDTISSITNTDILTIIGKAENAMKIAGGHIITRQITVSQSSVSIAAGFVYNTYGTSLHDDRFLIPYQIYGVR